MDAERNIVNRSISLLQMLHKNLTLKLFLCNNFEDFSHQIPTIEMVILSESREHPNSHDSNNSIKLNNPCKILVKLRTFVM